MTVSIIVSLSENDVIGSHGKRPWALPAERTYFEAITRRHPVIIGRKSYQAFGQDWLKKATAIVLSKNPQVRFSGTYMQRSLQNAIEMAEFVGLDEVFVAGGEQVFEEALPLADKIYMTRVHFITSGDAIFHLPMLGWKIIAVRSHPADKNNCFSFDHVVYERV
jgi:dihydrofolate reductase